MVAVEQVATMLDTGTGRMSFSTKHRAQARRRNISREVFRAIIVGLAIDRYRDGVGISRTWAFRLRFPWTHPHPKPNGGEGVSLAESMRPRALFAKAARLVVRVPAAVSRPIYTPDGRSDDGVEMNVAELQ
jgi:hypothetical protein